MLKSSLAAVEGAGRMARELFCKGAIAAALLSCSTMASALGLGEMKLHSALNQPLNAEIELLETGGLSNEDVVARLASPEAFAKAGIERVFFLNDLRFTPVLRGNSGVIRVVSNKPVTEPYLSFLVQLARPNGDLLHEYTVLLDPATSPQGLAATRSRNQQRSVNAAQESRMPVAPPAALQGKHYTVTSGDTLNGIASRLQGPGGKVSASQMA
ncbi:peptigoglycan-binding protein LysM, partial [Pseudomonas syringae pv. actinidiae]|nr:peptigoglycan-binding protein LysM [Pseudomonas syringae pv. actinidiae]